MTKQSMTAGGGEPVEGDPETEEDDEQQDGETATKYDHLWKQW